MKKFIQRTRRTLDVFMGGAYRGSIEWLVIAAMAVPLLLPYVSFKYLQVNPDARAIAPGFIYWDILERALIDHVVISSFAMAVLGALRGFKCARAYLRRTKR